MWLKRSEFEFLTRQAKLSDTYREKLHELDKQLFTLCNHLGLRFDKVPKQDERLEIITLEEWDKRRKERQSALSSLSALGQQQQQMSGMNPLSGMFGRQF